MAAKQPRSKRPHGGQTKYTAAKAQHILNRLAAGEALAAICKTLKGNMAVAESTVRLWYMDDIQGFAARYTKARDLGYECMAESIANMSDKPLPTTTITKNGDGKITKTETYDNVARANLIRNNRIWYLAKMRPKKYGPRVGLDPEMDTTDVNIHGGLPD